MKKVEIIILGAIGATLITLALINESRTPVVKHKCGTGYSHSSACYNIQQTVRTCVTIPLECNDN